MRTKYINLVLILLLAGMGNLFAQAPTARFTVDKNAVCVGSPVIFTNTSTEPLGPGTNKYLWDFGNGQLTNNVGPHSISYNTPGTKKIKLRVNNTSGVSIDSLEITVFPTARGDFRASANLACSPATIRFTDISTVPPGGGTIISRVWDFGDGVTQNGGTTADHIYSNLGYYNVTLTLTTSNGCEVKIPKLRFIRIINGVTPNFDFSRSNDCSAPVAVNFINQTTGPGVLSYQWTLGNGDNSTVKNPSTIYNSLGTYNVKLVARSSYGCVDSISKPISFQSNNTSFTAPDSVCPGKEVNFINNATGPISSASWDFGDGTTSKDLNPVKSFSNPGTYTVTLTNQYAECTGVFSKLIKITTPPVIDFTAANPNGCSNPYTVNFNNLVPGATSYLWDFGDGSLPSTQPNPAHIYTSEGNFDITLTVVTSTGCPSTLTKPAFVKIAQPTAVNFINLPAEGCVPVTVNPTADVTAIDGVASYVWNFGTGAPVTGQNPSFTYNTPGTYDVSVTITTNGGCAITHTLPAAVHVGTPPAVDFSTPTTETCAGDTVNFTSAASPADRWLWDFGDGTTSPDENPRHKYVDTGFMTVKLVAWNNGCADSLTKTNLLRTIAPVALFSPVYSCSNPRAVSFTNTSIEDASHGTTTYFWDFGNGQTSSVKNPPPVTYPALGTYTVTLTARDGICEYINSAPITLLQLNPDITINKPNICRGERFRLTATNFDMSQVKTYSWSVAGSAPREGIEKFDTSILLNGSYDVTLTLVDIHDCVSTITKTGLINIVGSDADFTVVNNGGCLNSQVTVTDQSLPTGSITNWNFNYGDGVTTSYTTGPFIHIYNQVGTYDIKLTTTDNFGCIDTISKVAIATITKPVVNFGAADTVYCPRVDLQFADSTLGNNISYVWDFGDGSTGTGKNPLHSFPAADAVYSVKLTVTDQFGCIDSLIRPNYIKIVSPKSAFNFQDTASICPPLETKFFSQAADYDSLYWDFGDGNTSTLANTSNFFNTYGQYTISLHTIGKGGCRDTATAVVNVYNPFRDMVYSYTPLENCNEITVTFTVIPPPNTRFHLVFDDGTFDSSQSQTITHYYNRPNFYRPYVELSDSLDCVAYVGGLTPIEVKGVLPLFDMDQKKFCDTGTVIMTDFGLGNDSITSRQWDFGDGTFSTDENPVKYYGTPGTYLVNQLVTTVTGCSNSYQDTVRVYRTPVAVIAGPDEICVNSSITLIATTVQPDSSTHWVWSYANGLSSTLPSISNRYTSAGIDNIRLTATNDLGCSTDTAKLIDIWPLPEIFNDPEVVIPVGGSTVMPITYSNNVQSWAWQPATNLSCVNCPLPVANPRFTTTYQIAVVDSNNCKAASTIVVKVVCVDKNYFIPNTFSPNNDGQNDVFYPRGSGVNRIQSMRIFNRWGEMIFDRKNFPVNSSSDGWNGQIRGAPAQSDAYVYIIEVICENGQIVPLKGNVTLIR